MALREQDLTRRKIELGLDALDIGPRVVSVEEAGESDLLEVHKHWPKKELAPQAVALPEDPGPFAPLPKANVLVITWTIAELDALAAVLTPGVSRHQWYRYARGFDKRYLPYIRERAPARTTKRLGSYHLSQIGETSVLCFKSELHLNQDGIMQPSGYATLPVKDLFEQLIEEVQPDLVITTGTAGATYPLHHLGDVFVTRAAKFRCTQEFAKAPFADTAYKSDFELKTSAFGHARELIRLQDEKLIEPDFAPPTGHYPWPNEGAPIPGFKNRPAIRIDGGGGSDDLPAFHPILSTDFFEFGTTGNKLEEEGCGVEMGDAVLGLAVEKLAKKGQPVPRWLVVRNASDPAINHRLPRGRRPLDMQAHWAVWYYEAYGFWTSVNSAIATWAAIVGDRKGSR